jgi:hypothetical protein
MKKLTLLSGIMLGAYSGFSQINNTFPSSGNVGVGINTGMAAKLHFYTDGSTNYNFFMEQNTTGSYGLGITERVKSNNTKAFHLENYAGASIVEAFKVYGDGRTLLGLTNSDPVGLLHLYTPNSTGYNLFIEQNTTGSGGTGQTIRVKNNGTKAFHVENATGTIYDAFSVFGDGRTLIGNASQVTMPSGYKLYVQTGILTEKVKIALASSSDWSDYVFDDNYKLRSLEEVNAFIKQNKHLPGIPSAQELVEQGGIDVAKMNAKLMEKIEELTLYMLQLNEKNKELNARIAELESRK